MRWGRRNTVRQQQKFVAILKQYSDAAERDFWDDYMKAYEEMIQQTATKKGPWYVVPADNKWSTSGCD